jgi:hypothetical protein
LRKSCDTLAVVAREDDHDGILNHALIQSRRRYSGWGSTDVAEALDD